MTLERGPDQRGAEGIPIPTLLMRSGAFAASARMAAGAACGVLGWAPETFWHATPAELLTALEGRCGPRAEGPLGSAEMRTLGDKIDG